jgi:hypothetical protein
MIISLNNKKLEPNKLLAMNIKQYKIKLYISKLIKFKLFYIQMIIIDY